MKALCSLALLSSLLVASSLFVGCGHKEGDGHGHGEEAAHGKDDGHGHGEESPSGASFKAGKGVSVTDETQKILGLEVADVTEEKLAQTIQFTAQVYGASRNHPTPVGNPPARTLLASGLVTPAHAALVRAGMIVRFTAPSGATAEGVVKEVHSLLASGDAEIDAILSETGVLGVLKSGDFVQGTITLPRAEAVTVIPKSALLRTTEGAFVYAVNGTAYFRTAVKVGAENNERVEITDGLLAGDSVVTKPVQTLWLIELRAVKGGGHSH
jgi:multidrug efflux pump subunit AcrA (membrane-fusion protein)